MDLIERDGALATLAAAVDSAASGQGRLVLVCGDAGIGKTSLVRAFIERRPDLRVLWGMCDDLSTPRVLSMFSDLVSEVHPELAAALSAADWSSDIVQQLIDELKREPGPVVLVGEDLQWADEATLEVLAAVGRRLAELPALIVLTYRDSEAASNIALRRTLGRIAGAAATRIELTPLSAQGVSQLAGDDADEVYRLTGGNPFFVTELVAHGGELPQSVSDAVLARLSDLPEESRAFLEFVSLIPGRAETVLLDSCYPGWPAAAVDPERAGMLVISPTSVAFRHELARRAVASSVPVARGRMMHHSLMTALVELHADPARIVHHAVGAGDDAMLLSAGRAAALNAHGRHAIRESVAHFRRIEPLLGRLSLAERADAEEAFSKVLYRAGHVDEAAAHGETALTLREELGDPHRTSTLLRHLTMVHWAAGHRELSDSRGQEAVDLLTPLPESQELADAYAALAAHALTAWDFPAARVQSEKAAEIAERQESLGTLAFALMVQGAIDVATHTGGVDKVERAVEIARDAGAHEGVCVAYGNLAETFMERHEHEHALEYAHRGISYAREHDVVSVAQYLLAVQSRVALDQGRWEQAAALARDVLAEDDGSMVNSLNAMVTLTRLAVRRGDEDAAIRVSELLSAATRTQEVQRILPAVVTAAEHAELIGTLPVLVPQLENLWQQTKDSELPWAVGEVAVWLRRAGCQPGATARTLPSSAAELAGDHAEAAQLWLALGCPFESSMVVVHAADPDLMVQGLAGLDELGAAATARWARLRLREHGVTRVPRGPRKETRANPAGLTSRQSAVLRLIAEQRTNAEIADELVVSVRTVDHHVAAILQKLNVENRKAAADKAREMGLI